MDEQLEANKRVVMRYVDEIQNQHRMERLGEIFAENVVDHMNWGNAAWQGLEAYKVSYPRLLQALPDLASVVQFQIAEGDRVVTFKTATGTQRGRFLGYEATGRSLSFTIIDIFRVQDGKITDFWGLFDEGACLRQMGVLPAKTAGLVGDALAGGAAKAKS